MSINCIYRIKIYSNYSIWVMWGSIGQMCSKFPEFLGKRLYFKLPINSRLKHTKIHVAIIITLVAIIITAKITMFKKLSKINIEEKRKRKHRIGHI